MALAEEQEDIKRYALSLIGHGRRHHADDLYLFPVRDGYELSFRYVSEKKRYAEVSLVQGQKLLLFYKFMAEMDVSEKRRPQVGAGTIETADGAQRLRFATIGEYRNHEAMVIRFLYDIQQESALYFLFPEQYRQLGEQVLDYGLYLFSGPTGSGKTTTMYALARTLIQKRRRQVITVEDPVEIEVADFLQLQVNAKINVGYEAALKSCLRFRPDILIVGEIRDSETAKTAVRAALTGHTVFSTIHGMNKESVLSRMLEFGVLPSDLRQSLQGIIYQRLIPCLAQTPADSQLNGVLFDTLFFKRKETYGKQVDIQGTDWNALLKTARDEQLISEEVFRTYRF